jgi:cytochrome c oxidase assembly protein subunit 15
MRDDGQASNAEPRILGRLAFGFMTLVAFTFGLIVLGALVRAHEAGLACPDWPLCFGQTIPEMNLEVAFEWSHRVLAGSVALAFATLAGICLAQPEARRRVGSWLALGTVLLLTQILLGALTVWQLLAAWTVTLHLLFGNAFAVTLLLVAVRLRRTATPEPVGAVARAVVTLTFAVLVLQIALGGWVASTYAGLACPEWPTCNGGAWYPSLSGSVGLHLIHRTGGYLLLGLLLFAALSTRQPRRLGRAVATAFLLGVAQVAAGIANVVLGLPVEVTGLHSALAAALVLTLAFALDTAWSRAPVTIH